MPYRTVKIIYPDGQEEEFRTRLGPEAFAEWTASRAELRTKGYPDRPPDVDTSKNRVWIPHPGEEGFEVDPAVAAGIPEFTVITYSWTEYPIRVLMAVDGFGDGSFAVRSRGEDIATGARLHDVAKRYAPDADLDMVGDHVEEMVAFLNARDWPEGQPVVADYEEYEEIMAESALATAEIKMLFQPPEGGPVQ